MSMWGFRKKTYECLRESRCFWFCVSKINAVGNLDYNRNTSPAHSPCNHSGISGNIISYLGQKIPLRMGYRRCDVLHRLMSQLT